MLGEKYGIYGIWFDNELVYIGKTRTSFQKRFSSHKSGMKYQGDYLYQQMREYRKTSS